MSESAPISHACPKCRSALPADATEGLCPRCLMEEAMQPTGPKKAWEPPTAAELGELLPEYDIEKLLGRGGMGAVYKGTQKSLDRPVAIKILSATLDESDQGFAERFKNEARALGKLKHPGIVGVYDFGTAADGLLYIVMEFIDGTDVAKMIAKSGRLHTDHAMAITAHVCDALAYAHSQGIIHRDIKPANIMVGYDGVVQVADFGLAKMTQSQNSGLTQSGMAMGTLHYMAPESLMLGTAVDHRADIYAVGVMLYQMLTGKLPQGLFAMPSLQIKGLDPRYDGIIGKALMEDRDVRYQSITEMRLGLDEILTQPVVKAEASAGKPPAALNTQARPKRPGSAENPEDHYGLPQEHDEFEPTEKRTSPWLWVVLIAILALGGWEFQRKRQITLELPPEIPVPESTAETTPAPEPKPAAIPPASVAPATVAPSMIPAATAPAVVSKVPPSTSPTPAVPPATPPAPSIPTGPTRTSIERIEGENMTVLNLSAGSIEKQDMAFWFRAGTWSGGWQLHWINDVKDATLTLRLPVKTAGMARLRAVFITSYDYGIVEVRLDGQILPGAPFNLYQRGTTVTDVLDWGIHDLTAGDHEIALKVIGAVVNSKGLHAGLDYIQIEPPNAADLPPNAKIGVNLAPLARPSASHCFDGDTVTALNDQKESPNSKSFNLNIPRHTFYDHLGSHEWVQYEWETPQYINESSVFWYEDDLSNTGSASLPFFWRLLYRDESGAWIPVEARIPDAKIDQWNTVKFPTVKTRGLRLAVQSGCDKMCGILEWKTLAADPASIVSTKQPLTDLFLGDLTPLIVSSSWGYAVGVYYFKSAKYPEYDHKVIRIDGKTCDRYLLAHTPSHLEFAIPQGYTHFKATGFTSFDTVTKKPLPGDWIYIVEVDDKIVFESKELRSYTNYQVPIEVPLTAGAKKLVLKTISHGGDANGHSLWGYPTLVSGKSSTVANSSAASTSPPAPSVAPVTKEQPFVNSLGMKFVPVPGTKVQFCIHETRYNDYAAYAAETQGVDGAWKNQIHNGYAVTERNEDHPVMTVSWEDAQGFCAWLSKKEGKTYRLPTDEEWSFAVGIAQDEKRKPGTLPSQVMQVPNEFPWGGDFPPKTLEQAGNYSDASRKAKAPGPDGQYFDNYDDGFPTTAPVMSFKPNKLALYDLGGNVWEWCEDWYDKAQITRVLRGGAWGNWERDHMLSSHRAHLAPFLRFDYHGRCGFRVVLELGADAAKSTATANTSNTPGDPPNTTRRVIDLIPLVDVKRDASNGAWSRTTDGISLAKVPDSGPRIQFPHPIATAEYDYEVEISYANADMEHRLGFPVFGRRIDWAMNIFATTETPTYFFVDLDGRPATQAQEAVVRLPQLKQGSRHHTLIKVRHGELAAFFDGKQVVRWKGDTKRFNPSPRNVSDPQFPDLFFYWGGIHIHQARVIEFVPQPPAPAPTAGPTQWTDNKGRTITATFKAIVSGNVLLEIAGKVQPVALNTLSAESQKLARELEAQEPKATGVTSSPDGTSNPEKEIEIAPGVNMTFVWCPPGSVPRQKANQLNEMEVVGTVFSLTKGFWIGKYEVTQEQWAAVIGNNPSQFKGRTLPVEMVDWNNANTFLKKVGKGFRLPTEAEWEYACRAGSVATYCFGDDVAELADYAWYGDDNGQTHPVGQKKPNAWGIHDMHGNVWEWCQDWKGEDYWDEGYKGSRTDPSGPTSGGDRVNRGGCWKFDAAASRSAQRGWVPQAGFLLSYLGFRVALSPTE